MGKLTTGIPIISTSVGVVPELAQNSTGILIIERSAESLKKALNNIFSLPFEKIKKMGEDNRMAVSRFTTKNVIQQYRSFFIKEAYS